MPEFRNALLAKLRDDDFASLGQAELLTLAIRQQLMSEDGERRSVWFLEEGLASVVANFEGRTALELGVIGAEGMCDVGAIYGDDTAPFTTIMQTVGRGYRFDAVRFGAAMAERPALRATMLSYARAFAIQVATTAIANGHFTLEERLCRWLLMASDRVGARFNITHEFISLMLAVRRSGVTLALQILEGRGFIRANRGNIQVLDRDGLIGGSNGSYGFAEREYQRLLGPDAGAA